MKKAQITTLLKTLAELLQALAADETPKPKPPPVPPTREGQPVFRYGLHSGKLEVVDGHGNWQEFSWKRRGLTLDDGLWIDPNQEMMLDNSPGSRYHHERMTPPRDLPILPR